MKTSNAVRMVANSLTIMAQNENSDMDASEQMMLECFAKQLNDIASDLDQSESELKAAVVSGAFKTKEG